jgi:hypothetical protein
MKFHTRNRLCYIHTLYKFQRVHISATGWEMRTRGCPLQNLAEKVTENCLMPVISKKPLFIVGIVPT